MGRRGDQIFFIVIWLPWEVERIISALHIHQGHTLTLLTLLLASAQSLGTFPRCGYAVSTNDRWTVNALLLA